MTDWKPDNAFEEWVDEQKKDLSKTDNEKALANLINLSIKLTKEANTVRGETNKTNREYRKALGVVCNAMGIEVEKVEELTF